jgi:malic enzyme
MTSDPISYHHAHCGKIETKTKAPLATTHDLAFAYMHGVGMCAWKSSHIPKK